MITEEFVEELLEDSKEILNQIDINILWWIDEEYDKKTYSSEADDEFQRKMELLSKYDYKKIYAKIEKDNKILEKNNVKTIEEFRDKIEKIKDEIENDDVLCGYYYTNFLRILKNFWYIYENDERRIDINSGSVEFLSNCICL